MEDSEDFFSTPNRNQSQQGAYSHRLSNEASQGQHESFRLGENFFRQIVESLEDYAVFTTDTQGFISSWNSGAQRVLGYTEEAIIGQPTAVLFTEEDRQRGVPVQELNQAERVGRAVDERFHVRKDGSRFWASGLTFPLKDEAGALRGFTKVMRDLSDQLSARQQVAESTQRFALLLETIPQMTWTNLSTGEVNFANSRWYTYTGLTYEQTQGSGWQSVVHPDDLPPMVERYHHSLGTGETFNFENRYRRHDNSYRWHLNQATPIRNAAGDITLWVGTATDIHDQKMTEIALQESEAHLSAMFDQSTVGMAIADIEGRFLHVNGRYCQILGRSAEDLRQLTILAVTHPDDVVLKASRLEQIRQTGESFVIEKRYVRPNGEAVWVLNSVSAVRADGSQPAYLLAVSQDITDRKYAQQALEQALGEMRQSNQQLTRINADLDNFIYTASHDLRAPISNIEGLMQALLRHLPTEAREQAIIHKLTSLIMESVERFKKTLVDLTQITKIQKEAEQDQGLLPLAEVVEAVQLDLTGAIQEAGAQLTVEIDPNLTIPFSRKNARSIVYNLLSNALKYRSPERPLRVRIAAEVVPTYTVLSVEDNGLGIDLSDENKIFAMFTRLHDHVEGSGLGLYIVKKMIDNASGRIEVKSQVDEGATFQVFFKR